MKYQFQEAISINFSITSATTLSGVVGPEVIPTLIFPLGRKLFLSSKSDPSGLWNIEFSSTDILSGVSIWKEEIFLVIAISCKWVVLDELKPPITTKISRS